ncbi:RagB/SusD family nutrient uptake outer membrane protein [Aquimarina sp. 2201CG5-10]|uniref:RagB/SusD family nutrient uptake outer membrane protein n=1 Tax=Aquimarina callyspongiae TaxID=3098150 RepID=UPI002AB47BBA|nr:RagB/SusD family nutrient uptake outer membrane protein [Aquimarina sp. 2201CG5-10]MDY8135803.1 RagB/SusD family nutrient uptake outer membrane protein [Aquimarina sp. 2201CG5-10]
MQKKIYIIITLVFTLIACEDTLEQRLSNSVEVDEAIVDINSLNLAANGAYSPFASSNNYNRSVLLIPEIMSDNAFIDAFDNTGRYLDYDTYTVNANDNFVDPMWNNLTSIIANTSIIIRRANELTFPETVQEDANQYIGEMYMLRALAFHNFQLLFAQPYNFTPDASHLGVPIPDFDLLGDGNTIQEPGRSTTAQVYAQIVSDLETAIDLMRSESSPFRADEYAAKALLARVYLHMENWTQARDISTDVILNSGNELLENQEYLGSWALDSNDETLFTIVNNETDNSGTNSIGYFYLTYEDAFATDNFVNTLSDTDVRKGLYPADGSVNLVTKFPRNDVQDDNIQVLRLSEMYLIKAEAHAQLSEELESRLTLDIIIQRADPAASPSAETGQALLDKIILERRKELAYEGFRLYDLTRYGMTFNKFRQDADPITISAPENRTILPIPIDEINVNPNIAGQQNPGY